MFAISCLTSMSWARSFQSMSAILFLEDRFQCFPPLYTFVFQMVFPLGFLNKSYACFIVPCMLHTPLISSFVWFLKQYFVKIGDYEPAHNTVFLIPLLLFPFSPTYHSQHPNSNTLSLRSSLLVTDQVSLPYKTTCYVIVVCILIFTFLGSKLFADDSEPNSSRHCTKCFLLLLISFWI